MSDQSTGVTVVVPVCNGERWLEEVLGALLGELDGRPSQLVVIDDGSDDASLEVLRRHAAEGRIELLHGGGHGAAAAINLGVRRARFPVIAQVDQDVVVQPGWLGALLAELADPQVAAAQGYYDTDRSSSVWARVMGYDLELRYAGIRGRYVDHVCTGNTVFRTEALHAVGLFDEILGYGYDNDMSYRLTTSGRSLRFCRDARSIHRWREGLWAYLRQQYGVGYGRLDLIARHPERVQGDRVSGPEMILHVPTTTLAVVGATASACLALVGGPWRPMVVLTGALAGAVIVERLLAGARAALRFRDAAGLAFVPAHLLRNLVWAWALLRWGARRLARTAPDARHSMRRR